MAHEPDALMIVGPIARADRIESIDVLRGFAVLGIFAMNLPAMAFSEHAFYDPRVAGGFDGADRLAWWVSHLLIDLKMMSIFSMLFGAGLIIFAERAGARGGSRPAAWLAYRRLAVLAVIGVAHAYLLWHGDILVYYALCGAAALPFRRFRPRALLVIGAAVFLVNIPILVGIGWHLRTVQCAAVTAASANSAGHEPTDVGLDAIDAWQELQSRFIPPESALAHERDAMRAGYVQGLSRNAAMAWESQTTTFALWGFWRCTGLILIGMAMLRLGVFTASRSVSFYISLAAVGYLVGVPATALAARAAIRGGFDLPLTFQGWMTVNYIASVPVALGHVAVVMMLCRSRLWAVARQGLAATGRMALTNYLLQSAVGCFLFRGWGLGWYDTLSRAELWVIIVAAWAAQMAISVLWLSRLRFGPVEWAWRSLTYGRLQRLPV